MVDLLTELRNPAKAMSDLSLGDLCRKAADEIQRLRNDRLDCQVVMDGQHAEIENLKQQIPAPAPELE